MIPQGEDWRIRKALGYMAPDKVLQWAQVTICPSITLRDVTRISRDISRQRRAAVPSGHVHWHRDLVDNGSLALKIDAFIAARSKECGVHPDFYRRALGWR